MNMEGALGGNGKRRFLPLQIVSAALVFLAGAALAATPGIQCYTCHGTASPVDYRPLDRSFRAISSGGIPGNHRTHLPAGAVPSSCERCHPGSSTYTSHHRDGSIKIAGRINDSPLVTTYRNVTSAFPQSATATPGSCRNVNCHFEAATPSWGAAPLAAPGQCNVCHGAPPADGNHPAATGPGKKHGDYYGTDAGSCGRCHADHRTDPAPFAHATSAGKRGVAVAFSIGSQSGGSYSRDLSYPGYLPSQNPVRNGTCSNLYCHSNAVGGQPLTTPRWGDSGTMKCYSCHRGRAADTTAANCAEVGGTWDTGRQVCSPFLDMSSNGHHRLVGAQWIRKYPCSYCHSATTDESGAIIDPGKHVNGEKDVKMAARWAIVGRPDPSYDQNTKVCANVYCHSDGTTDPEDVRPFAWTAKKTECNSCHGHPSGSCANAGCHDGRTDATGKEWPVKTGWEPGKEWMGAMPMFPNQGAGTARANSHPRHAQTEFACDECHAATIRGGSCLDCHAGGIPLGGMGEVAHINADYHVNKAKDVVFKKGGSYNQLTKTCSNTACHTSGTDPVWGGSVNSQVTCLGCHGTSSADQDDFDAFNGIQAKINLSEWVVSGHGRYSSAGPYPVSGNPPAKFPGNPCWYCHDNNVLHKDATNPYRLRKHPQFSKRFEKECVYCHMEGNDSECLGCHQAVESLAPQLGDSAVVALHSGAVPTSGCRAASCHDSDDRLHKTGSSRFWTAAEKEDVKNQYIMMGVCLQCHDDDSGGQCTSCHVSPPDQPYKYSLGFDPGTGFIKPKKARASAGHFGYKHFQAYENDGIWKGGKFCWDCHDPHGDSNIYMIQNKVATTSDGTFGIPQSRADVVFTRKQSGADYARTAAPYNGICNVCHMPTGKHYTQVSGDNHNSSRVCTTCHEHRFADSHADDQPCDSCHSNKKPVPKHSAFSLPRDCTKCHAGTIGKRMDVMGQLRANSHHIQRADGTIKNTDCYQCHWESTPEGLIDVRYHQGYNYKTYSSVKNAPVDLVIWKPGVRPTFYNTTTAVQFLANNIGTAGERVEAAKVSNHCLGCHSDQNKDSQPFDDCKTPRQYAWDRSSIGTRYSQTGTTTWGKYAGTANATKKSLTKAFSAHGNAAANQGGWDGATGVDGAIPNLRNGATNVQCFDCHSSHGSKAVGVTSSYVTFNGTRNGANLKETQAGKGGYAMTYKASSNPDSGSINPYNTGAGQCFDCHLTKNAGITPWGYNSTFGNRTSIMGYRDTARFGTGTPGQALRYPYKNITQKGGHLKASSGLKNGAMGAIDGLCTPCHDPHGVSPTLGADQAYAVPMLKGTWLTSPYPEDAANPRTTPGGYGVSQPTALPLVNIDQKVFGANGRIAEDDSKFAGLCLRCHPKSNLTAGPDKSKPWKSVDRIHQTVKGWGVNDKHSFSCSKCHVPHVSNLPRLMQTNCLDVKHRGQVASGGQPGQGAGGRSGPGASFPQGIGYKYVNCHPDGAWPSNYWNTVTPW